MNKKLLIDIPNPFSSGIVSNPWIVNKQIIDIEDIHQSAFIAFKRLLSQDVQQNGMSSMLIHGTAGIGKTHLIARIVRHVREGQFPAIICYCNLDDVSPQLLWLHLRRKLVDDLLTRKGPKDQTGLNRLLAIHLPGHKAESGQAGFFDWMFGSKVTQKQIKDRIVTELFDWWRPDIDVRRAFLRLASNNPEEADLARMWFLGDRLDEKQLERLGMSTNEFPDSTLDFQSQRVVLDLLRLGSPQLPIVLCFDQIEHLMLAMNDLTGYNRFGQMVSRIRHDAGPGIILVTFIRSDQKQILADTVGASNWARLAENETSLSPLNWEQANRLVLQRMESINELNELRKGQPDPYWPMTKDRLQAIFHKLRYSCTPRQLLEECKKEYDKVRGVNDPYVSLDQWLLDKWKQRCAQQLNISVQTRFAQMIDAVPWLAQLLGSSITKVESNDLREYFSDAHLIFKRPNGSSIILTLCSRHAQLWQRLDRILLHWRALPKKLACNKLILICDTPVDEFRDATKRRFHDLQALPGVTVSVPQQDHLSYLHALHSLFSEATKQDLLFNGREVTREEVHQWASSCILDAGHEIGVLRLLFDDLDLELLEEKPIVIPTPT